VRHIAELDFKKIEEKWKKKWADEKIFETEPDSRKKWFGNSAFPYVNAPLHIGHGFTYTRLDVMARFKRMQGFNTLFPFAFHATGEPIVGVSERLKKENEKQKKILLDIGIDEEDVEKFKDPEYIASYWEKRIKQDIDDLGISADWRRKFTSIDKTFNKFITWQYKLLKEKGYVIRGTHPVVWCSHCKSPTGDHDRLEGEGESPVEYLVFKFMLPNGEILPTGTLRPETIYGVTNIWVNPDVEYVKVRTDGEVWIVSEECMEKLKDQLHSLQIKERISGEKIIGKRCVNPVTKQEVLVLPAGFVKPENSTGIVMSVPSHAPYDWAALRDIVKDPGKMKKYGIEESDVKGIEPIAVVKTEGLGEHPAVDACENQGIESQEDVEKLDRATNQIYKKEFHRGILNERCGEYKNRPVAQAKEVLSKDLKEKGLAVSLWEVSNPVVCRCGTACHVKILENQWFLKFSDEEWKEKVRECLKNMEIFPEEARLNFKNTIEWLRNKACARKSGLGTKLPWDKEWIVETLSDSVIYMAYYTIANHIRQENIKPDQLKTNVFDYVFRGIGDVGEVSRSSGIKKEILQKMKNEFEYWYGFDLRGSAKELIPNHLTYSLFHHTAVWGDRKKWPRAFTVNGMVTVNGQKMSKSKGNFIILRNAIEKHGADAVRITLMDSAEGMNDVNWIEKEAVSWKNKLASFYNLVDKYYDKGETTKESLIDVWLISRVQNHIKKITGHLEKTENRSALMYFHQIMNDMNWYFRRAEKNNKNVLNYVLETATKILSIYSPFISEEIWEKMKKKGFISTSEWPKADDKKVDKDVLQLEDMFKKTCDDIKEIIKLSGKMKKLYLYVVTDKEMVHFKEAADFLRKQYGFDTVKIFRKDDPDKYDPQNKSERSRFGKPGIYVE
jgi:leucyl-tRNA synthetase